MSLFHVPPGFGKTPRPHLHMFNGQWWATFPSNFPEPTVEVCAPFSAWLRKVNGISGDPSPTAFFAPQPERVQ